MRTLKQKGQMFGGILMDDTHLYMNGYTPTVCVSTWHSPCKMVEIKWKQQARKMHLKEEDKILKPRYIEQGDVAEVVFMPMKPFIVYPFDEIQSYGRILAIDQNEVVMIGKVLSVEHDNSN